LPGRLKHIAPRLRADENLFARAWSFKLLQWVARRCGARADG
jgi:hypothetical protein